MQSEEFITDHLGNKYVSKADMCRAYKISIFVFKHRIGKLGWDLKRALMTPVKTYKKHQVDTVKDHLGNEYKSITEMCQVYGINSKTFRGRYFKLNWDLEKSLTTPINIIVKPAIDHLGNKYPSIAEMCAVYNIGVDVFRERRDELGWTLEQALTTPIQKFRKGKPAIDHLGNKYPSIAEMCRTYGVSECAFRRRTHTLG